LQIIRNNQTQLPHGSIDAGGGHTITAVTIDGINKATRIIKRFDIRKL